MFKNKKNEEETESKDNKKYPEVVVGTVIVNSKEEILLAKSRKWNEKYTIFGGHIERGESIEDAVEREAKEETGLNIKIIGKLGFGEAVFHPDFNGNKHFIFLDYLCLYEGDGSDVKICNKEFYEKEHKWTSIEEAEKLDLAIGTKQALKKYIEFKKSQDSLDGWKRCQADFENYRKRQDESRKELREFILEDLALQIMPVVDNFQMSLSHVPENQKEGAWVQGILHIQRQLETILKDNGISEIEAKEGDAFNPEIHEAVENHQEEEKEEQHKIKKIISKGYKIGEKVIRAAKVIVE